MMKKSKAPDPQKANTILDPRKVARRNLIFTLICAGLAGLLYINTLSHDFAVDDVMVTRENSIVKKGPGAIGEIMTTPYRKGFWDRKESLYRPLSLVFFSIEWAIAPKSPFPGHLVNLLFYMLTALVLFKTLNLLLKEQHPLIPFLSTVLFIAHPMHTEVVANIKSLDEILCFLLSISAIWFFARYTETKRVLFLALAGISVLLATLSKESAVTMLAIVPLTLWFFTSAGRKQLLLSTLVTAAGIGIYLALRINALGGLSNFAEIQDYNNSLAAPGVSMASRLATAIMLLGKYLFMQVVPYPLSLDYSFNTIKVVDFTDPAALLALLVFAFLIYYVVKNFKKKDVVVFGILFFGIAISPVSNILVLIESTFGERFTYIPSLGFCLVAATLLVRLFKVKEVQASTQQAFALLRENFGLVSLFAVWIGIFSVLSILRNMDWKDNLTLYRKDVRTNPLSARMHSGLGRMLISEIAAEEQDPDAKNQLLEEGLAELKTSTEIYPNDADAWFYLGEAYKELKDYPNALQSYRKAYAGKFEKDARYHSPKGIVFGELKQYDSAFYELKRAIELAPKDYNHYNNLGLYQLNAGLNEEALKNFKIAFDKNPKSDKFAYNIGNYYAKVGNYKEAITWYKKSLELKPGFQDAINNVGNCYSMLKDYNNALVYYKKNLDLNPSNKEARYNMGVTYMMLGDTVKGKEYLQKEPILKK